MATHKIYIALGSNLGNKLETIHEAIRLLAEKVGPVAKQSQIIESKPEGYESENMFLNAVVMCLSSLTPHEVLRQTQDIERELGKRKEHASLHPSATQQHSASTYHDRPIDIDILLYDDLQFSTPVLTIPHPRMYERSFVMEPLREINPDI